MSIGHDRLAAGWSPIVELRRYTLHPEKREVLIDLFDRDLVEPQEQAGMKVIGQFRDLDAPDMFTWLRGFPDMPRRAESLAAFYDGPVWQANRDRANATMVDSDDVLLLRPARPHSAFTLDGNRPPPASTTAGSGASWRRPSCTCRRQPSRPPSCPGSSGRSCRWSQPPARRCSATSSPSPA
jgi:NIPSNAP